MYINSTRCTWGCTSGGVYLHCIYTHARSELHKLHQRYTHARWVTVGDSGRWCCTCVTYFERQLTPLCVDSARALWASVCFRFFSLTIKPDETLKWLWSLPIFMQKSFWRWQCSDRYSLHLPPTTRISVHAGETSSETNRRWTSLTKSTSWSCHV